MIRIDYLTSTFYYEDGEFVGELSSLTATQYYVSKPNKGMGSQTFTTKIGYEVTNNFEIGVSLLWRASNPSVVTFKNFEEEIYTEAGDESEDFIIDQHNRVGYVVVATDRLSCGLFIKYGLSKSLEQKRKKSRKLRKQDKKEAKIQ